MSWMIITVANHNISRPADLYPLSSGYKQNLTEFLLIIPLHIGRPDYDFFKIIMRVNYIRSVFVSALPPRSLLSPCCDDFILHIFLHMLSCSQFIIFVFVLSVWLCLNSFKYRVILLPLLFDLTAWWMTHICNADEYNILRNISPWQRQILTCPWV